MDEAYQDLARRTNLVEVKIFVMASMVQRQTGGNLAELLEKLSVILRDRFRIQGVVKALTAEGRMQALVLMGLPPLLFFMMFAMNPGYMRNLMEYPKVLGMTFLLEGLGGLWIRKIVNFDF